MLRYGLTKELMPADIREEMGSVMKKEFHMLVLLQTYILISKPAPTQFASNAAFRGCLSTILPPPHTEVVLNNSQTEKGNSNSTMIR